MEKLKESYDIKENMPKLPPRRTDSHKGTFGRLLCVCGSVGMAGAAYLCAKAAYRSGVGLVEILTCEENRAVLQTLLPEAIVSPYNADDPDLSFIKAAVCRADGVVIGCGLGKSSGAVKVLGAVLRSGKRPMVIDADALNIISDRKTLIKYVKGAVITPHIGEMARLCSLDTSEILSDIEGYAKKFAKENSLVCVLKCHNTAVADDEGRVYVNHTGNSGMATGGSGDVLAGIIGSLLVQGRGGELSAFDGALLGVCLHGLAGDIGAEKMSEYSLMAGDIIDCLPEAIKSIG